MATSQVRWVGNVHGATVPWVVLAKFLSGTTQAIKKGEILEYTADTNAAFTPIDSDYNMATSSDLAIANQDINAGDAAGYYEVILPREGDIFAYDLAAASGTAPGTALYFSSSEKLTVTAGTNIIAYTFDWRNFPKQGHASLAEPDAGTSLKSATKYYVTFRKAVSFANRFLKA